jgi:parallel beta-helix repeat protein
MRLLPPRSFHPSLLYFSAVSLGLLAIALLPTGAIAQAVGSASQPVSLRTNQPANQSASQAQQVLLINPTLGSDRTADGSQAAPFRTITRALEVAQSGSILLLSAGTYSTESGETFPLRLKPGVTLQGDPTVVGQGFLIQGGGEFLSPTSARQNVAILGADRAVLVGVTVTNPNPRGYGLWVESSSPIVLSNTLTGNTHDGISTVGNSAPLIQGNVFTGNGANGITIFGASHPEVRQNVFEQTGFGINIADTATPLIVENRISQNRDGIVVQENARPVIRGNLIEGSQEDGIAAIAQAQPDLGTAANPGNNVFLNNRRYDINAAVAKQTIVAAGNQLSSDRTAGQLDLAGVSAPNAAPNAVMVASASEQVPVSESVAASADVLIDRLPPSATTSAALPTEAASHTVSNLVTASTQALTHAPAPRSSAPRSSTTLPSGSRSPSPMSSPIAIPVPPPERHSAPASIAPTSIAPALTANATLPAPPSTPSTRANSTLQADLLPVPNGDAPVGNIGDLPTVNVPSNPGNSGSTAFRSDPAAPLQFRVLVEAASDRAQTLVQSLIPNAFVVQAHGRSLMQVGAFNSRENAEAVVQMLNRNGLRAAIERMN